MKYHVENGVYFLDSEAAKLEKDIINYCLTLLEDRGFEYLSIPSTIKTETFKRQDIEQFGITTDESNKNFTLAGSSEQGILEYFSDTVVKPRRVCAYNQCFRDEETYEGLHRLREFRKVEQFVFCFAKDWEKEFESCLKNCEDICEYLEHKHRKSYRTYIDQGYHKYKVDIEIETETYGWIEICSCTYFEDEQTKRFGIKGGVHTISCTGVASPRILIPILERHGINGKN